MGKVHASLWVETSIISLILWILISLPVMKINDSPYALLPALNISISIALLATLLKTELKKRGSSKFGERAWVIGVSAIAVSILVSFSILMIRISSDVHEAVFFSILHVSSVSTLLTLVLAFTLVEPEYLMKKSVVETIVLVVFMFFSVFFSSAYSVNYIMGNYPTNIPKINGVYYELEITSHVFGWLQPLVRVTFSLVMISILLAATVQYIRIKNKTIKKYYSFLYFFASGGIFTEFLIVAIIPYIFHIKILTFFSVLASLMSIALTHYLIHIREAFLEVEKLMGGEAKEGGVLIIFRKEEEWKAIEELKKYLDEGRKGAVFYYSDDDYLEEQLDRYKDKITFIKLIPDGYVVGWALFSDIEDLEKMGNEEGLGGAVIYSRTLDAIMNFPCEKRYRILQYYRFLFRAINEGAVVISTIAEEHLLTKKSGVVENPLWTVKPIIVLRLEEFLNTLKREIPRRKIKAFLRTLNDMEKIGMPYVKVSKGRICLNPEEDMDRDRFSALIKWIGNALEENDLMNKEKYLSVIKQFFSEYGKEYYMLIMMWPGEINFISSRNSIDKAIRVAISSRNSTYPLIISRVNPHILKKKYGIDRNIDIRWLTTTESKDSIYPHLEEIKKEIFSYLERYGDGVIVLDGLEYLVKMHGFDAVLRLLWILQDRLSTTKSTVIIPVNPNVLEKRNLEALRRDFHFVE